MQLGFQNEGPTVLTVDQVTRQLKAMIEGAFPRVVVEGEVVSCRPSSSGHVYFSLRGQRASLPCVAFRSTAQRLPVRLRDGLHIQATGGVELYPPHGRYQLVLQWARPSGEGELLARLEEIKRRLHQEGLFAAERKRTLPWLPRRIGIATSPTGAAIRDLIRSIHMRFPVPILVAPCAVQGPNAAPDLIDAVRALDQVHDVDVIVVGRGGGSLEDLWAFNHEGLARAIAASSTPVVSAVGHEIDTPVSDLVADVRAATPTGVGELVVPDAGAVTARLDEWTDRATRALTQHLRRTDRRLESLEDRLRDPGRLIRDHWRRLDDSAERLDQIARRTMARERARLDRLDERLAHLHPQRQLERASERLAPLLTRLTEATRRRLEKERTALNHKEQRLRALGPDAVLDRGYAIVRTRRQDGATTVVRDSTDAPPGTEVEILLGRGALRADVTGRTANPLREDPVAEPPDRE